MLSQSLFNHESGIYIYSAIEKDRLLPRLCLVCVSQQMMALINNSEIASTIA